MQLQESWQEPSVIHDAINYAFDRIAVGIEFMPASPHAPRADDWRQFRVLDNPLVTTIFVVALP